MRCDPLLSAEPIVYERVAKGDPVMSWESERVNSNMISFSSYILYVQFAKLARLRSMVDDRVQRPAKSLTSRCVKIPPSLATFPHQNLLRTCDN